MTAVGSADRNSEALPIHQGPRSIQLELLELQRDLKKTGDRFKRLEINKLKEIKADLDALTQEEIEALEKVTKAAKGQTTWTNQAFLSSALFSGASIIGGMYLFTLGDTKGLHFIGSGIASFTASLAQHHRIFGKEHTLIPIALNLFTFAWNTYASHLLSADDEEFMSSVENILRYLQVATGVGSAYSTYKKQQADIHLTEVQEKITLANKQIDPISRKIESDSFTGITGVLKRTFLKSIQAMTALAAT